MRERDREREKMGGWTGRVCGVNVSVREEERLSVPIINRRKVLLY